MEGAGSIVRVIGAFVLVLGLLLLGAALLRRLAPRITGGRQNPIQVLATRAILPRKHLCLVRVGDKTLIIGASEGSMSLLGTWEGDLPAAFRNDATEKSL
ncbi:MAG: flagellar biosynthetic protein FliO [Deltaproteobacteria bacterium]